MTDEATAPRRLRAADVIDAQQRIIEQLTQRSSEPHVSVEYSYNAKGDTQSTVKVAASLGADLDALMVHAAGVETVANAVHENILTRYPRTNGGTE